MIYRRKVKKQVQESCIRMGLEHSPLPDLWDNAYMDWHEADKEIKRRSIDLMYTDRLKNEKIDPLRRFRQQAWNRMLSILKEAGLTSRSKRLANEPEETKGPVDPAEEMDDL